MTDTAETAFTYRDGELHAESLPLARVAEAVGTPCFVYSSQALEDTYRRFSKALSDTGLNSLVCYAIKANPHLAVVKTFGDLGSGADVVSEGELRRAIAAGVPPERIVFAGVGKQRGEMAFALEAGILQFNVESPDELKLLNEVAGALGKIAPVALRINPNVDAKTHAKITTGTTENKFGIEIESLPDLLAMIEGLEHIAIEGLAVHIGSQLTDLAPYAAAFERLAKLFVELRQAGVNLRRIDLGGGLGISYTGGPGPDVGAYAEVAHRAVADLGVPVIFEPGRHLVGNAGLLLARVLYVKQGRSRRFLIVDAAMNDLIRPTLYDAWHEMKPLRQAPENAPLEPVDVVGPICESGDIFASARPFPPMKAGELFAIFSTGAYGATMSSTYNTRLPAPEVMVRGDSFAVIKSRPSYEDLLSEDQLPDWLRAAQGAA